MAGGLEWHGLWGPFWSKPFCDSDSMLVQDMLDTGFFTDYGCCWYHSNTNSRRGRKCISPNWASLSSVKQQFLGPRGRTIPSNTCRFYTTMEIMPRMCLVQGSSTLVCKHSTTLRTGSSPQLCHKRQHFNILIQQNPGTSQQLPVTRQLWEPQIRAVPDFLCNKNQKECQDVISNTFIF